MKLSGRVAVVTGATGSLGSCICEALASAGMSVVLVYRDSSGPAQKLAEGIEAVHGVRAASFAADVSDPLAVDRLRDTVRDEFGAADVLINDAAVTEVIDFSDLTQLSPEVWSRIVRTNLTGPFLCARAFAADLASGDGGRIVNISSIAARAPIGSNIAYAVSKAGLDHLTRCLAVALAPDVLVNGIAPGYLEGTRLNLGKSPERIERSVSGSLLGRPTSYEDVAAQILGFVHSQSVTGQTLCIDAGRVFP